MKDIKQVVWTEGMLLGQQHFQLWDRYTHARQNFQRETIAPLSWGLVSVDIDHDSLQNGQFQLSDYSVIFPDFSPHHFKQTIYYGQQWCRTPDSRQGRYVGFINSKSFIAFCDELCQLNRHEGIT